MHLDLTAVGLRVYLPTNDRLYVCDDAVTGLTVPPPMADAIECSIRPHPMRANGTAVLSIRARAGALLRAELFDALGKSIALLHESHATVSEYVTIPVQPLKAGLLTGIYFVRVEVGSASEFISIIDPAGLAGLQYLYSVYPLHGLVFRDLLAGMAERAYPVRKQQSRTPNDGSSTLPVCYFPTFYVPTFYVLTCYFATSTMSSRSPELVVECLPVVFPAAIA